MGGNQSRQVLVRDSVSRERVERLRSRVSNWIHESSIWVPQRTGGCAHLSTTYSEVARPNKRGPWSIELPRGSRGNRQGFKRTVIPRLQ